MLVKQEIQDERIFLNAWHTDELRRLLDHLDERSNLDAVFAEVEQHYAEYRELLKDIQDDCAVLGHRMYPSRNPWYNTESVKTVCTVYECDYCAVKQWNWK